MPIAKKTKALEKKVAQPKKRRTNAGGASISQEDKEALKGLALRTRGARMARGYDNKAKFATAAGVSKQYIGNIELARVKQPSALPMVKVARALNVSLDWLLTGDGLPDGSSRHITPVEFDTLRAFRDAPEKDQALIQHILKPYMKQFGKPLPVK